MRRALLLTAFLAACHTPRAAGPRSATARVPAASEPAHHPGRVDVTAAPIPLAEVVGIDRAPADDPYAPEPRSRMIEVEIKRTATFQEMSAGAVKLIDVQVVPASP